jgi:hypothetical protein
MDVHGQYARWRVSTRYGIPRLGLPNRQLALLLGDFVYESSSAEDESRRILELLYRPGRTALTQAKDLRELEKFTSEHNRTKPRALGVKEPYVPWSRIDALSQEIVHILSDLIGRDDSDFLENMAAIDRMFSTTSALRTFRNAVDHYAPSDVGGRLHFYRDSDTSVSVRDIWGWIEVAARYSSNPVSIGGGIALATGIKLPAQIHPKPLQWPPHDMSIHGLRIIAQAGIDVPAQQLRDARREWITLTRRWNRK